MRETMRIHLLAFFLLVPLCASVHASELPIGMMVFTLGSDQIVVMKEVRSRFHVVSVKGDLNKFILYNANPPNNKVPLGSIAFENGRLAWIDRNWGFFEGKITSTEVMKALFAALESAIAAAGTAPKVSTEVNRGPGIEFKSIYFEFPGRKITVGSEDWDTKEGRQLLSIDESISLER
jgi:hypothetical protein